MSEWRGKVEIQKLLFLGRNVRKKNEWIESKLEDNIFSTFQIERSGFSELSE